MKQKILLKGYQPTKINGKDATQVDLKKIVPPRGGTGEIRRK